MVAVIDSFETFKTVTGGDKLVIIDFWATWSVFPSPSLPSPRVSLLLTFIVCQLSAGADRGKSLSHRGLLEVPPQVHLPADLIAHPPFYSKVIGPVFEKLESSFPNIGFYKCDVDEQEVRCSRSFGRFTAIFAFLALLTLSPTSHASSK